MYYEPHKHANSPAMRDRNPTVILISGLGMITWGQDKSESRVIAEFNNCAHLWVVCSRQGLR